MSINGARKGKAGEREVAALVQEWWRKLEPEAVFVRTPQSGGWGTPKLRGEFKAAGDLMVAEAPQFPFTIEVKREQGWSPTRFLNGGTSPVWGWWQQVQKAALEEGRVPMLWFRRNRAPWWVLLPHEWAAGKMVLVAALHLWERERLRAVNYGGAFPACFEATAVLSFKPEIIVR